ncbi:hypothetical protein ACQ86O_26640 [Serratia sp. L9]
MSTGIAGNLSGAGGATDNKTAQEPGFDTVQGERLQRWRCQTMPYCD